MSDPRSPRLGRRALLGGLAAVPVLGACGASPRTSPPSGVDELVVPTPSPDPADFVEPVDNPWFPLPAGARWEYAVGERTVTAEVAGTREVAGVATTELAWSGRDRPWRRAWFAQDTRGNVWQLGGESGAGEWLAGVGGAQAGLAMPAHPRRGDGFRPGAGVGVVHERLTVVALDGDAPAGLGVEHGRLLVLARTSGERTWEEFYARGIGLVARTPQSGAGEALLLLTHAGSAG